MNLKNRVLGILSAILTICNLTVPVGAEVEHINNYNRHSQYFSIMQDEPLESTDTQTNMLCDATCDGKIDYADILVVKKHILSLCQISPNADANGDGVVNVLDLLTLNSMVLTSNETTDTKTICLDAGHYALYNRSPAIGSYYESNMTWKLHLYLKEELEAYGFKVITTRESQETDRPLISRGQASAGCDLFLSIHSNAVGSYVNEKVDFPLAIVLVPDDSTNIDEISAEIGVLLADTITNVMQTKQVGRTWTKASEKDHNGDGILNDEWYGVLHGAKSVGTPAILLEHSFHTNTRATKWLLDDSNLHTLAKAEAKTLAEYFGLA